MLSDSEDINLCWDHFKSIIHAGIGICIAKVSEKPWQKKVPGFGLFLMMF